MLSYIVAMDQNRAIGKENQLPWHLPADLQYFKRVTTGHPIVMGRKTYQSIGRPLPKRRNVVMTRDRGFVAEGCEVVHEREQVMALSREGEEFFVIGGSELFQLFWHDVDRLYVTLIHETFAADTFFPPIDEQEWRLISSVAGQRDEKNRYDHDFLVYERMSKR
ncbi:dihydrofolate reductase [Halalkalibacter oceani]|uniref:dihydrofolate reductase n=1 Tax=Halalkalibacter oceani TaxID=1653776 RepID=UPI0033947480